MAFCSSHTKCTVNAFPCWVSLNLITWPARRASLCMNHQLNTPESCVGRYCLCVRSNNSLITGFSWPVFVYRKNDSEYSCDLWPRMPLCGVFTVHQVCHVALFYLVTVFIQIKAGKMISFKRGCSSFVWRLWFCYLILLWD